MRLGEWSLYPVGRGTAASPLPYLDEHAAKAAKAACALLGINEADLRGVLALGHAEPSDGAPVGGLFLDSAARRGWLMISARWAHDLGEVD